MSRKRGKLETFFFCRIRKFIKNEIKLIYLVDPTDKSPFRDG